MSVDCPKCKGTSAWYSKTHCDLILRCSCGFHKVVFTTLETGATVETNDSGSDIKLPKKGTFLWDTLKVLQVLEMETSAGVTERLRDMGRDFSTSDVSNYLAILRSKGLVVATTVRRGVAGGSTWILSEACKTILGE